MRLVVATACLGKVETHRERSMANLALALVERGVDFQPDEDLWENTMPGALFHARNRLLWRAADELDDDDRIWWNDGDVSLKPALVLALLAKSEAIIAKGYPLKASPDPDMPTGWSAYPLPDARGHLLWNEERSLLSAHAFVFGAVMMRASLAKRMLEKYGTRGKGDDRSIPLFDFLDDARGNTCPEDVSACYRMREAGEHLWIAPWGKVRNGSAAGEFMASLTNVGTETEAA